MTTQRFRERARTAPVWSREQIEEKVALAEATLAMSQDDIVRAGAMDAISCLLSHERLRLEVERLSAPPSRADGL